MRKISYAFLIAAAALLLLSAGSVVHAKDESPAFRPNSAERRAMTFEKGPKSLGALALTFDDGPHPRLTPRLLAFLDRNGIKATFFLLGEQVEKFPEVARAIVEAGHEIGNHSFSHADLTDLDREALRLEIRRTQDAIEEATGRRARLFRPPYGSVNASVYRVAAEEGLQVVIWSIDPRDWDKKKSRRSVAAKIERDSVGGSIVLLHDIHERTIDLVPEIVASIRDKGLGFITVGPLIQAEKQDRERRRAEAEKARAAANAPPGPVVVPLSKSSLKQYEEKKD